MALLSALTRSPSHAPRRQQPAAKRADTTHSSGYDAAAAPAEDRRPMEGDDRRWSARRALLFVVVTSIGLWGALIWIAVALYSLIAG